MNATSLQSRPVEHVENGTTLESLFVHDAAVSGRRPAVIVCHTWAGRAAPMIEFATLMARWGYRGLAADIFGKGVLGNSREECEALMMPFVRDRAALQRRLAQVVDVAAGLPEVDPGNIAAVGFCFGGLCVLDLARIGANVRGVASFHGVLAPPGNTVANRIDAKIVAYHGWDDPLAPPEAVLALGAELTAAKADWQLHAFGGAMHAFTAVEANDPQNGIQYHEPTARRSVAHLRTFLAECFGGGT
jgi:dienelactone hydrolase